MSTVRHVIASLVPVGLALLILHLAYLAAYTLCDGAPSSL